MSCHAWSIFRQSSTTSHTFLNYNLPGTDKSPKRLFSSIFSSPIFVSVCCKFNISLFNLPFSNFVFWCSAFIRATKIQTFQKKKGVSFYFLHDASSRSLFKICCVHGWHYKTKHNVPKSASLSFALTSASCFSFSTSIFSLTMVSLSAFNTSSFSWLFSSMFSMASSSVFLSLKHNKQSKKMLRFPNRMYSCIQIIKYTWNQNNQNACMSIVSIVWRLTSFCWSTSQPPHPPLFVLHLHCCHHHHHHHFLNHSHCHHHHHHRVLSYQWSVPRGGLL